MNHIGIDLAVIAACGALQKRSPSSGRRPAACWGLSPSEAQA